MDYGGRAHVLPVFIKEKCGYGFDFFNFQNISLYKINQHCANTPPKVLKKRDNNDYPLTFLLIIPLNRYLISCICAVYGRNTLPSEPLHRDGGNKWS